MAATTKRNRELGKAPPSGVKMTADEYHELIGKHEHIEHKALRQEVAKEFAEITKHHSAQELLAVNDLLNPPQPPPIPLEANKTTKQTFRPSAAWPKLSVIQRAAHMFRHSLYEPPVVEQYLETVKVSPIQIKIAKEVYYLMEESERYWKKLRSLNGLYEGRYNGTTRKYALSKVPWPLQLAMTLTDFHVDHIVDIVYKKPFWARDFVDDAVLETDDINAGNPWLRRKGSRSNQSSTAYQSSDGDEHDDERTTEYGTSAAFYDEDSTEEEEEEEFDSESQPIGKNMLQSDGTGSSGIGGWTMAKVAHFGSKEEMDESDRNTMAQAGQSLASAFEDMFKDLGGDTQIAFGDGFVVDMESDGSFDVAEKEDENGMNQVDQEMIDNFNADYPTLKREVVEEVFIEENKDVEATKCRLDMMSTQKFITSGQ